MIDLAQALNRTLYNIWGFAILIKYSFIQSMLPKMGDQMAVVCPRSHRSFILDSRKMYWRVYLNTEEKPYLGYLKKYRLGHPQWVLKTTIKSKLQLDRDVQNDFKTVLQGLNTDFAGLQTTAYRFRCRKCKKKLKDQDRRLVGYGRRCQAVLERQKKLDERMRLEEERRRREREEDKKGEEEREGQDERRKEEDRESKS